MRAKRRAALVAAKIPLLKIPHTVVTGHGESNLVLSRKLTPYWSARMVSEGAAGRTVTSGRTQQ